MATLAPRGEVNIMLLTVGALIALAVTVIYRTFAPPRANPEGLGRMSQQWLVENRVSDRP